MKLTNQRFFQFYDLLYSWNVSAASNAIIKSCIGGDEKAKLRHTKSNCKILVRDRLTLLLDKDFAFMELTSLAGLGMDYGTIPNAGVLTGIGIVSNRPAMIIANDATVKAGTIYPISLKKQLRAQEIALLNNLPCIYLIDSGGGFLPLQAEIFPDAHHGGRSFYNQAVMSAAGIPQISVVLGSCTAGGAYIPTMSHEAVMVEKSSHIFLAGPPLVAMATGEVVSAEDLGGAIVHCTVSGSADYHVTSEAEAMRRARRSMSLIDSSSSATSLPQSHDAFRDDPTKLRPSLDSVCDAAIASREPVDLNDIECLFDEEFYEYKADYGANVLCAWTSINGRNIGVVANRGRPQPLSERDCLKGANFLQLCNEREHAVLFLQNCHREVALSPVASDALSASSKWLSQLSCLNIPFVSLVLTGSYGPAQWMFGGRAFKPAFHFCWPSAEVRWGDSQEDEFIDDVLHPSAKNSGRCLDDGLLIPSQTRQVIERAFHIITTRSERQRRRLMQPQPVIRM